MRRLPSIILCAALPALILLSVASGARDWDNESQSRKADYIFIEAQNALANEDLSTYITLMLRAYELDSTDVDIAGEWGVTTLGVGVADSAMQDKAYNKIRARFLANPSSYTNGTILANVASHMRRFDDVVMVWETLDSIYPTRQDAAESLANAYVIKAITGDTSALTKALTIYRRLEDGAGKNVPLTSQIIRAHMLRNDTASVISELSSLLHSAAPDSYTALYVGSTYDYLARPDSALKYFDMACELDSANGSAYMARATFYRNQDDSVAFDREVFHALNSRDLEVETKVEILRSYVSDLYMDSTQHPRIDSLFDHLDQLHPGTSEIHSLYAAYLFETNRAAQGAEQMMYAVALDPANEPYHTAYLQMLTAADKKDEAIEEAVLATKKFPANLYFPLVHASILHSLGQSDSALAVIDSVDISEVANPNAVSNFLSYKADLLADRGDTLNAISVYDHAINLNPDNISALNNCAYFLSLLPGGDLEKALRYSSRAIKAEPNNATYLDTYAWILFMSGDMDLARQYIDATIRVYEEEIEDNHDNPDYILSPDIYDHAGDIYYKTGDDEKAREFWQKALEIDPGNASVSQKIKHAK